MIWLLLVVAVQTEGGKRNIDVDGLPFEKKERCLKNLPVVKEQLLKAGYDIVHVECQEKVLNKGN